MKWGALISLEELWFYQFREGLIKGGPATRGPGSAILTGRGKCERPPGGESIPMEFIIRLITLWNYWLHDQYMNACCNDPQTI